MQILIQQYTLNPLLYFSNPLSIFAENEKNMATKNNNPHYCLPAISSRSYAQSDQGLNRRQDQ